MTDPDPTSALAALPAAGDRRGLPMAARLKFFYGPMDCGKSTLALQIDHNHARQGRCGLRLTKHDRSGAPQISSRLGMTRPAVELDDQTDLRRLVREHWSAGERVDYVVVDEAQFLSCGQVEQLVDLVDGSHVDVYAFGIATDFRSRLFPGSRRLFELADEIIALQVEVLCWCGRVGQLNARVIGGEGDTVVVADAGGAATGARARAAAAHPAGTAPGSPPGDVQPRNVEQPEVRYQVLCRPHYRAGDLGLRSTRPEVGPEQLVLQA